MNHELVGVGLSNQETRNEGYERWGAGRQTLQCLRPKSRYHVIKDTGTCLRVQAGKYKPLFGSWLDTDHGNWRRQGLLDWSKGSQEGVCEPWERSKHIVQP